MWTVANFGCKFMVGSKLWEKKNDVNSANVLTVINLSRALRCKAEDFIKY